MMRKDTPYIKNRHNHAAEAAAFVRDCCVCGEGETQWAANLYAAYVEWARNKRRTIASAKSFGIGMRDLGFERRKSSFVVWLGVGLRSDPTRSASLPLNERKSGK